MKTVHVAFILVNLFEYSLYEYSHRIICYLLMGGYNFYTGFSELILIIFCLERIPEKSAGGQCYNDIKLPVVGLSINYHLLEYRTIVIAGGSSDGGAKGSVSVVLEVAAKLGDPDWGIVQSPFMRDNASTVAFRHKVTIDGDRLSYAETTSLEIYGRQFEHTDENELVRT